MASNTDKTSATAAPPPPQQQQTQQPETLLYFAFGSNLSSTQMRSRCPGAVAVGLAFLPGYDFIINERGFANVIPSTSSSTSATKPVDADGSGVYGVLYRLASTEEKQRLDRYEGVPWAYEDLVLGVQQLSGGGVPAEKPTGDSSSSSKVVQALVYVDRARVSPSAPRAEYVVRMNAGIREAGAEWGLPRGYVREVMRRYIPAEDATADGDGDDETLG